MMLCTLPSSQFLVSYPSTIDPISTKIRFSVRILNPHLHNRQLLLSHVNRFRTRKPIIITCAKNSKGLLGSERSRRLIMQLVSYAAWNLNLLPEPLGSVIREFGGGNGGGGKGFRWGNFGGGGGGGGRRGNNGKKKKMLGFLFWGLGVVCVLGFLALILGRGFELHINDVGLGAMVLVLALACNKRVLEWILGFCTGVVFVGLLLLFKDDLQRLIKDFKPPGNTRRNSRGRRDL